MSNVFDQLFPNVSLEERVMGYSHYSTIPNDALRIFMEQYREVHPEDPAGVHFAENMNITEWDE